MVVMDRTYTQRMEALDRANAVRTSASELKAAVKDGVLSIAMALEDERAESLTVWALLIAQRGWGRGRVRGVLNRSVPPINGQKLVRELTARQRAFIAEACSCS